MREAVILSLFIVVAVLFCLSCGCDRKPLAKSELDNPLISEDFANIVSGKTTPRISQVYNRVYSGMSAQDALKAAGSPDDVITDIDFLKNFGIPKKGWALVYSSGNINSYAVVDPSNERISKVIYENTEANTGFEYIGTKPAPTVFDITKGMTESEVVAILGKPDKIVDGARDLLQYSDPENYFRYIYSTGKGSSEVPINQVEFEFSKTDRKIKDIYYPVKRAGEK